MTRRNLVGSLIAAVAIIVSISTTVPAVAAGDELAVPGHHLGKVVYPTVSAHAAQRATTATAAIRQLSYGGGVDHIGVTTGYPKVYLVFWGSQWGTAGADSDGYTTLSGDPSGVAGRLQRLFKGVGTNSETWSGVMTQYCEGVAAASTTCPGTAPHEVYPYGGALAGVWLDNSIAVPQVATEHQLAAEAVRAASHFDNTTAASNRAAQYFVVSPHGTQPDDFNDPTNPNSNWCAWHDWNGDTTLTGGAATSTVGDVAFTNLPYLPDAGASCGQSFVNSGAAGSLDGVSLVAGHEYAETITDQNPLGGWSDSQAAENADKCAWISTGTGAAANVTFSTGSFPMQSTWANDAAACEMSHAIVDVVPGPPTSPVATPGDTQATVAFTPPAANGGSPVTSYTATATDSSNAGAPPATATATSGPIVVSGLTNGDSYTIRVTATNGKGTGSPSVASNAVKPATAPGAPTAVSAAPGNASVTVSFTPPPDGGSAISGYSITSTDITTSAHGPAASGAASPVTVAGLTNGHAYTFVVTAHNAVGAGPPSAASDAVTPRTVPSAPTGVSVAASDAHVTLAWSAPSSDGGAAVTGYDVYRSTSSGARGSRLAGTTSTSYVDSAVANGTTYYYAIVADNAVGSGAPSTQVVGRPHAAPTVTLTATPAALANSATSTFQFAVDDAPGVAVSTRCSVDGGASAPCSGGVSYGLSDGAHTFAVSASDADGLGGTSSYSWTVDTHAPLVSLGAPTAPFTLSAPHATWRATDVGSGVATYDVRYRRAAVGTGYGAWISPAGWQGITATATTRAESPGVTECFAVRARDHAGNTSAWTTSRCTTVPLDDRSLTASSGWQRTSARSDYRGTGTTTRTTGATLTRRGVSADRLALVATECTRCGTVQVSFAGRVVTVSLHASTTRHKVVIVLPRTATTRSGTVTIRVTSRGRPVEVDGLAATRS